MGRREEPRYDQGGPRGYGYGPDLAAESELARLRDEVRHLKQAQEVMSTQKRGRSGSPSRDRHPYPEYDRPMGYPGPGPGPMYPHHAG
jgi:hypothetical protein